MISTFRNFILPPPAALLLICLIALMGQSIWLNPESQILSVSNLPKVQSSEYHDSTYLNLPVKSLLNVDETTTLFLQGREAWRPEPVFVEEIFEPEVVEDTAEETEPVAPTYVAPNLSLLGSMQIGHEARALVKNNVSGAEKWVVVGDDLGGWIVGTISNTEIILHAGVEEIVVKYNR